MQTTLTGIQEITGGKIIGDANLVITGVASVMAARPGDITFVKNERYFDSARKSGASAIVTPSEIDGVDKAFIVVDDPFRAFAKLLGMIAREKREQPRSVHVTATIHPKANLGQNVSIGANAYIDRGASIHDNVIIYPNVYIGHHSVIGEDSIVYPNVTIREEVVIGKRCTIHPNTSIGGDGFGYLQHEGTHVKIPQVGGVRIGDDVEIGSNCTIDRAALDQTVIGNGVKIDNHSHIAHNVIIGDNTMLIAYAKIAGGTTIGKNVMIAEDVGITDNVTIGDACQIGGGSKVYQSLKPGAVVWGTPAKPIAEEKKIQAILKRLPKMREHLRELRRIIQGSKQKP